MAPKDKTPGATYTEGLNDCIKNLHSPTIESQGKAISKQLTSLAQAGHVVHCGQSGDFLVCKYGLSRYCKDFAALQAYALKLGVNAS